MLCSDYLPVVSENRLVAGSADAGLEDAFKSVHTLHLNQMDYDWADVSNHHRDSKQAHGM